MSPQRKTRWMTWINSLEAFVVLCIIACVFYLALPLKTPRTLFIPKGNASAIITHLRQKGIALTPTDAYLLRRIGTLQHGWIHLGKTSMSRLDLLYALTDPKRVIDKITLIPGETLVVFFDQLHRRYDMNATALMQHYRRSSPYPEAGILADTYYVPHGIKEKPLIDFLVRSSEKRFKRMAIKAYGEYNTTRWQRILTVASIVQKEAANTHEMPMIASVIYNRLHKKMRLQMDGTLNYGAFSHVKVTPKRIREDNTTFNTYKHRGLPDSPVASVQKAAIGAALHPAQSDYLYFVKNRHGTHDFSKTFKAHRKRIKALKKQSTSNATK